MTAAADTLAAAGPLGLALDAMARAHLERTGCEVLTYDAALDELIPDGAWTFPWAGERRWDVSITKRGELFGFGEDVEVVMVIDALVEAGVWREVDGVGFVLKAAGATA